MSFPIGSKVRLTGPGWEDDGYTPPNGTEVVVTVDRREVGDGSAGGFIWGETEEPWYVMHDGYWAAELVDVKVPGENNYEQVKGLEPGTIFQFGKGSPWLRTTTGVLDLLAATYPVAATLARTDWIPTYWRKLHHDITVLYVEPSLAE
jgi:hypothetical protein